MCKRRLRAARNAVSGKTSGQRPKDQKRLSGGGGRLAHPSDSSFWLARQADYYETKTQWLFETPIAECLYGHGGNMAVRARLFEQLGPFLPMPIVGDPEILHRALARLDDATLRYEARIVVTHLEVVTLGDMLPKLERYGAYSAAISRERSYRSLTTAERLRVMVRCMQRKRYGPLRALALIGTLALGALWFERGRRRALRAAASRN